MSKRKPSECNADAETSLKHLKELFSSPPKEAPYLQLPTPDTSATSLEGLFGDGAVRTALDSVTVNAATTSSTVSSSSASRRKPYQAWIKMRGYDENLQMNVFSMHADGGIICLLCSKHRPTIARGKTGDIYTAEPARPQRPARLDKHLCSDQHREAVNMEKTERSSQFSVLHQNRILNTTNTVAERVHLIYWIMKEEVAINKVASLQTLLNRIGHNELLRDLRHTSSTAVTEFMLLISEHLSERIVCALEQSPCWASMVDETTGIASLQQYITFVQYVDGNGCQASAFLDIRRIDDRGATCENLFRLWTEVAADYSLDLSKHVAIACDGDAASMFGRENSLSQKVTSLLNPHTLAVHCHAHRLALACTDTADCEQLQPIQDCERGLVQTWKYFALSPLKTAKLQEFKACIASSKRRMVKACRTRWLSHRKAVIAMKEELSSVFATLEYFAVEKKDCAAMGILDLIRSKQFFSSLYLLDAVLPHLNHLSLLFQKDSFNFSRVQPALLSCRRAIQHIADSDQVLDSLKADWEKLSNLLPTESSANQLLDDDIQAIRSTTKAYCDALLSSLNDRFPESDILYAFRIFDPREIPTDPHERALYGNSGLELLIQKFNHGLDSQEKLKVLNDYQILKDLLIMEEYQYCKSAGEVCSKICRDVILRQMFPELHRLCCIALTIPLAPAWAERGFSTLSRVVNRQANRLLDSTLNALMNVSMNGRKELSDADGLAIAEKWIHGESRCSVMDLALNAVEASNGDNNDNQDDDDEDGFDGFAIDHMETGTFIL